MKIPNYKILKEIGSGGMGTVYLAEHELIGRKVAIKSLHINLINNKQLKDRFKKEATALAQLEHPNIVRLNEYIEQQDGVFLIMEYVDGLTLDEHINTISGPISEEKLIPMFLELLNAFEYAHKNKIIHRDIKPSNIIISKEGKVKILDFGIAKILDETNSMTKTGTQMGSVFYMSPEQVRGEKVNHLTDIYSLGVTLFQMATGKSPYDPTSNEYQVFQKIDKEPLPNASSIYPGVSSELNNIIQKATSKNAGDRFQSCQKFLIELNKITKPKHVKTIEMDKGSGEGAIEKTKEKKSKKLFWLLLIFAFISTAGYFAYDYFFQTTQYKNFYDEDWEKCKEKNAKFYRIINLDRKGKPVGIVKDYYITGEIQWEGYLSYYDEFKSANDSNTGVFKHYYKNGNIESSGNYINDLRNGKFKYYYQNGSLRSVRKYIQNELDSIGTFYDSLGLIKSQIQYKNGLRNGIAKWYYNDSDSIKHFVTYVNDTIHGKVKTNYGFFGDSVKIEGDYKNGQLNGFGVINWMNGDKYEGEFKNYLRHGFGTYTNKDGSTARGIWENGVLVEEEKEKDEEISYQRSSTNNNSYSNNSSSNWQNSTKKTGCIYGDCENGHSTYKWGNGDKYVGKWKNGSRTGFGVYTWKNGDKYIGEYKDGVRTGYGTFIYKSGVKYIGQFENNSFDGFGTYIFKNGDRYIGQLKNNDFNGYGTKIESNEKIFGLWKDDELVKKLKIERCVSGNCENGNGLYFYKDGSLYYGLTENSKANGQGLYIWENGKFYEGKWKDDKENGDGKVIFVSGIIFKGVFQNGNSNDGTMYYTDGSSLYLDNW